VVSLGEQLSSAFEELYASGQELRDEHGIEVNATLDFPLREAWFDWKAKRLLKDIDGRSR
jgi:hypothetical protein